MRTDKYGRVIQRVSGPFRPYGAVSTGNGTGGLLDTAIVGKLDDGTDVIIGEIWAKGVTSNGHDHPSSLDARHIAEMLCDLLNRTGMIFI